MTEEKSSAIKRVDLMALGWLFRPMGGFVVPDGSLAGGCVDRGGLPAFCAEWRKRLDLECGGGGLTDCGHIVVDVGDVV